jgi:hypothetical protein
MLGTLHVCSTLSNFNRRVFADAEALDRLLEPCEEPCNEAWQSSSLAIYCVRELASTLVPPALSGHRAINCATTNE